MICILSGFKFIWIKLMNMSINRSCKSMIDPSSVDWIDIHFKSNPIHPGLDGNAARQPDVWFWFVVTNMEHEILLESQAIGLPVHSFEPVVVQLNPAVTAEWSLRVVVVRSEVRRIVCIIAMADVRPVEWVGFTPVDCVEQWLSGESFDDFDDSKCIFAIHGHSTFKLSYSVSLSLGTCLGIGSEWSELNVKDFFICIVLNDLLSDPNTFIIIQLLIYKIIYLNIFRPNRNRKNTENHGSFHLSI